MDLMFNKKGGGLIGKRVKMKYLVINMKFYQWCLSMNDTEYLYLNIFTWKFINNVRHILYCIYNIIYDKSKQYTVSCILILHRLTGSLDMTGDIPEKELGKITLDYAEKPKQPPIRKGNWSFYPPSFLLSCHALGKEGIKYHTHIINSSDTLRRWELPN